MPPTEPKKRREKIVLYTGPMFSGKSSELITTAERHGHAEKKALMIKYSGDIRYGSGEEVVSHSGRKYKATSASKLEEVEQMGELESFDVILIDEGQFFEDLATFCFKWACEGKKIFVAALHSDFKEKGWKSVNKLIPKVDDIQFFHAVCKECKKSASKSKAKDEKLIDVGKKENIGGIEKFTPVCSNCFSNGD